MNPKGKTALITGGARIGQAVAVALAKHGADIAMTYRKSKKSADATLLRVREQGVRAIAVRSDITIEADRRRVVRQVVEVFGRLDILIHMTSIYEKSPFRTLNASIWARNMATNLEGAYLLSLLCVPHMRRRGSGRIIHFTDWVAASRRPRYKDFLPYYVSKSGIIGLTEALALELAPGILVNAVAPGPILPPPDLSPSENHAVRRATPLGRWGGSEEIAKAVLFLIESDFVTGECIRVDGGRHLY
jgi:NAD(P)-dependent dehydrogenase (short-subunit alcohol dehydrogenase family)